MANEIQIAYPVAGSGNITCGAYYDNAGTFTQRSSIALSDGDVSKLYVGDDPGTWVAGDMLVFLDGTTPIDAIEYEPNQDVIDVVGTGAVVSAGYVGDYKPNETVHILWKTTATRTEDGAIRVYRDDNTSETTTPGITDIPDFDSKTNVHLCIIDLSANSFFTSGADYSIVLEGETIGNNSINAVIGTFSIENRTGIQFERD